MRLLSLVAFTLLIQYLPAQDTINTQRPSLSENGEILPAGAVQFENGVTFEETEIPVYSVFARFGATRHLECRASTDLRSYFPTVGLKVHLSEAKHCIPSTAFFFNYDLHKGISDVRLTAGNTLGHSRLSYSVNAGYNGRFYGIGLVGCTIFHSAGVFIEWMTDETFTHTAHAGFTWMPAPRFQVDAYGGYDHLKSLYSGVGFSWLLP